ncbi:peptidoglycan bridge formation glycyltransferase FemA/FemB family protein [Tumidithrix elongata RA019]|uniref:Peptidoglycan bridge formation glycyltransferase FemA/FemB family protein n=1 Tax=Tumidithrix elongata BACA0141 TaxID=2716417 RepID=A0AAW9Q1I5_9CYAN|nr:peptidoglycan bridge formation glycyltransferase FemA/FemB family protein [Tumidithrix elongata RA019]
MLYFEPLIESDRYLWDDFVKSHANGCFMQSWAWANFRELEGYKTFRYGLFSRQLSEESSPLSSSLSHAEVKNLVGGCILHLYAQRSQSSLLIATGGPLFLPEFAASGMELFLKLAEQLTESYGAIAVRIEPLWSEKPAWFPKNFVRSPADLMPKETLLIDLQPTSDQMLAAMKPKGRYNLRLSQRHGVKTEFTKDEQAIALFYNLFCETVERQEFYGEPFGFFINLCQTLFRENMAEIGLAQWQGEVLTAILVIYWGDRCTYLYGGRTDKNSQVMSSYALHWAAMQRAKQRGCKVYDFYGYSSDPNHNYAKFSQFKRQFGGTVANTIGAQDYFFYDRLADTIIGLLNKLETLE